MDRELNISTRREHIRMFDHGRPVVIAGKIIDDTPPVYRGTIPYSELAFMEFEDAMDAYVPPSRRFVEQSLLSPMLSCEVWLRYPFQYACLTSNGVFLLVHCRTFTLIDNSDTVLEGG